MDMLLHVPLEDDNAFAKTEERVRRTHTVITGLGQPPPPTALAPKRHLMHRVAEGINAVADILENKTPQTQKGSPQ